MQTIQCPNCKSEFELTQAFKDQITAQISKEEKEKFKNELEKVKLEEKEKAEKRIRDELELKLKEAENEQKQEKERREKLIQDLLKTQDENRTLKQKDEERELENQKKLIEETKKIQEKITKQEEEKIKFRLLEKEQQLDAMKKTIEELQRKSEQTSQQIQGEVLEIELETQLRNEFPHDSIEPVGKGVSGSDIRQVVKTPLGNTCGIILWECKRTKAWSDGWISKLKEDMIKETETTVPVIVSIILPEEAKNGIGLVNRVWVCNFNLTLTLAHLIRNTFLGVAKQKKIMENSTKKSDLLYAYITSSEFKQQIEFILEIYQEMDLQIQKERVAFEKSWKIREAQIQKLFKSTANVIGSMSGKIGSSMPQIKGLDLLEL